MVTSLIIIISFPEIYKRYNLFNKFAPENPFAINNAIFSILLLALTPGASCISSFVRALSKDSVLHTHS